MIHRVPELYVGEATRLPRCEKTVFKSEESAMLRIQRPISERYTEATPEQLASMIFAAKETLGDEVFVLGHHYQRDEVMEWADARGDSFKLAQLAQQRPEAKHIVFCGVHFTSICNTTCGCNRERRWPVTDRVWRRRSMIRPWRGATRGSHA